MSFLVLATISVQQKDLTFGICAIIMLGMVLNQVGLPLEGIAIVMGVDRFLDMLRTSINITGDAMVTIVINKSEQ